MLTRALMTTSKQRNCEKKTGRFFRGACQNWFLFSCQYWCYWELERLSPFSLKRWILEACSFIEKRLRHRHFSVHLANFLRAPSFKTNSRSQMFFKIDVFQALIGETLTQVSSREYCKNFKNSFCYRITSVAASFKNTCELLLLMTVDLNGFNEHF